MLLYHVQELGVGRPPASRLGHYRLFVAAARDLARARVRLADVRAMEAPKDRRA